MVRKVHRVQRFSRDVVDGAPAAAAIYLQALYKSPRPRRAPPPGRPEGGGPDLRWRRAAQSWVLNRPCRALNISRENCAWLM